MPGLFDGIRNGISGIMTSRRQMEVTSNNIANAANENYTQQVAQLSTSNTIYEGSSPFGQGVEIRDIERIRDHLLDEQIWDSASTAKGQETQSKWLKRIETVFNEPSEEGINQALSDFWEAFSELSVAPENFATRSTLITKTEYFTTLVNGVDEKLVNYVEDLDTEIGQFLTDINALAEEIANLNKYIFNVEIDQFSKANDLRDQRDAAIEALTGKIDVRTKELPNGMTNVFIDQHPIVYQDRNEDLVTRQDPLDVSKLQVIWEHGDTDFNPTGGEMQGLLQVRDTIIPAIQASLDSFSSTMISEVNKIYANGVGLNGETLLESQLGFGSFQVNGLDITNSTTSLNLVSAGSYGAFHVSFYDSSGDSIRTASIVVDNDDSLDDIVQKLNNIRGLNASTISSTTNNGRLRLELDTISGSNSLGETSFAISNNTGGYDSSGFLDLVGFSQTAKSTNTSTTAPVLTGVDLSTLQTQLGEPNVADVMSHVLNLSGTFTINMFETFSETAGFTDGNHMQQLSVDVASTDTINSIMAKINALTANYGVSVSLNASDQLEVTTTSQTDANDEFVASGGTNFVRLSFANTYQSPSVSTDTPPSNYNSFGDELDFMATMQMNTMFQGSSASDIAIDDNITGAAKIHAAHKLAPGDNSLALDMVELQHSRVAVSNQFTIGEQYQTVIADIGSDVRQAENLADNEKLVLEGLMQARDTISGVSLDEELGKMILFQRTYEANARMIRTFDEMLQELLQ
ncbi:hypothetical protein SCG7109_AB_00540 [Chlamydiales bacterium SCGC AG-110-M15]|nr:hypothetical protein SCG7109_AB_00540 [Chlamydiales bacterium SCGC AG-110-M15]